MSDAKSKALEYTKDIVVAVLSSGTSVSSVYAQTGYEVGEFFEAVFNKIVELENN